MDAGLPLALFAMGLASGVHCLGMCGGIVTAFSAQRPLLQRKDLVKRQLAFNLGRITSYAAAGALGSTGAYLAAALPLQNALYVAANLLLIFIGAQLAGWRLPFWRWIQPLAARLLPARNLPGAYAAGAAWGWLPCGLVYGALAAAAFAGSPARGAAAMLAFGLGTAPWLLAAGTATARLRGWLAARPVRLAAGGAVLGFGAWGLAHADGIRQTLLCF